jgi:16S rRNA (cytosine967-C5)-methyltransferase
VSGAGISRSQTVAAAQAVLAVLPAAMRESRAADRELTRFLRARRQLGSRDRRLINELVFSLFRWWGWVGELCPQTEPADDAKPWARLFLVLSAIEGDGRAAIHDYWCEAAGLGADTFDSTTGLVTPAERFAAICVACGDHPPDTAPERLVPEWVPDMLRCPRPFAEWAEWMQQRPPLWLRVQKGETDAVVQELAQDGIAAAPHTHLGNALNLGLQRVNLETVECYRRGALEVQDLASQAVAASCDARPGEYWWDACAGAGGKALVLAQQVGAGRILATDVRPNSLRELARRAARAGLTNIESSVRDAMNGDAANAFDGVLVDAPCSGSGTWRRAPWARWQISPDAIAAVAATQQRLLNAAADGVKSGGVLMYTTCSQFPVENADVVDAFLSRRGHEFTQEPFLHPLTGEATDGRVTIWPWDGDGDVMFAARLRRV